MQILSKNLKIDFIKYRWLALAFSSLLIISSIGLMAVKGLNFGLDFTGGTLIEVGFENDADLNDIKDRLNKTGFEKFMVQNFGTAKDVIIRLGPSKEDKAAQVGDKVLHALREGTEEKIEMRRIEFVGSSVGEELTEQGGLAILVALIGILIYVSVRFEWKFAVGSVIALAHDVIVTLGFFALSQMEFDLTVLAAVLAVIGYSLNDTIVVFDRVRENFLTLRKQEPSNVFNISLNQTLRRTLMTSFTTLLVLAALFSLGGASIHGFATALLVGVIIGTYSSIYVASTSALALGVSKEDLMPPVVEKEGADQEPLM